MLEYIVIIGVLSLVFAGFLAYSVLKQDKGTKEMQEVANAIREGSNAFMKRQYLTIGILSVLLAIVMFGVYNFTGDYELGKLTSMSFLFGAFCSTISGLVSMWISIRANLRTAAASSSLEKALKISLRAGAAAGITIISLSLLGVTLLYYLNLSNYSPEQIPLLLVGFGFGASFVALFAQLGGGIYTKAADIGADLVGKVEQGIPEDDPRNPAVIADLVGDNVGDCAGRGADIFESTAAENIGAMIIGVALFKQFGVNGILFPLIVMAFGLIASIIGVMLTKSKNEEDPMKSMSRGYILTTVLCAVFLYFIIMKVNIFGYEIGFGLFNNIWFFYASLIGLATGILLFLNTIYYTHHYFKPVKEIAKASEKGHATNVITGFAYALESTAMPVIILSAALLLSYKFGLYTEIKDAAGNLIGGLYGTAVATIGLLSTVAYILAMDIFGPISDNAGGIVEMSALKDKKYLKNIEKLDATGNTTKALTKGYAIGSAALAAFLLFNAYLDEVKALTGNAISIDISKIEVFIGGFLGAMLVFIFSAFALRAVGDTALIVVEEVRRQFKEKKIMQGKDKPDYAACVDICTKNALREMVIPGLLILFFTVGVGFLLKAEATAAYLVMGTISGVLLAILLNNAGGAWDNAKKYIESGVHGGKGSEAHKGAVTGDTVGDGFKDTVAPSLHILIKLLGTLTLVLLPLFI
ncbi:MAG: sodium-translocating pyrophosphatase [Nanoarchaeota archaeon]